MVEGLEVQVQQIYEPVQPQLDQVVENMRGLAAEAGLSVDGLVEQVVDSGGKKVRPAVTLLAAGFHPYDYACPVVMATAVELLHIATLIHDDTIDNSDMRRGRATISSMWGRNVAILLGDYVFATSATFVCNTDNVRVIRRFSETIMELATGELSEHFSAHDWQQTREAYETRIYKKTASLFCTAAESGAVLSGAPEETAVALKSYGYYLGMAFQIMDDILDFQGTEAELGKPVGNDLLQGILTLPALLFLERYPNDPVVRRLAAGSRDQADLRQVVEMIKDSSTIADAFAVADQYRDQAVGALRNLEKNRSRRSLEELTDYVNHRRS